MFLIGISIPNEGQLKVKKNKKVLIISPNMFSLTLEYQCLIFQRMIWEKVYTFRIYAFEYTYFI